MREVLKNEKLRLLLGFFSVSFIIVLFLLVVHEVSSKFNITDFKREIEINYGSDFKEKPGRVCYGSNIYCSDVEISVQGNVDTNKIGRYELIYTYKYKKKKMNLKQVVIVSDIEAPKITIDTSAASICPNDKIVNSDNIVAQAIDNLDGDISDKINIKVEGDYLVFTVSDSSDNVAEEKVSIVKQDTEAPKISLVGDEQITLTVGEKYKELGASAIDNCDNVKVEIKNNVDTSKKGTYKVVYSSKDDSGNISTKERTVLVENKKEVKSSSTNKTSTTSNKKKGLTCTTDYVASNKTKSGSKVIYLTFDDGPSKHTARLLDVLKKYNVKVTFFVTGFGEDSIIKREYDEGHTVALHTYTHNYKTVYSSVEAYYNDLYKIRDRVKRITGVESNIIRFPGGSSNTVSRITPGLMSCLVKDVQAKGFHYFDWNVSSGDAGATTSTSKVYSNVVNGLRSDVSVVLQHDSKGYSVDAVEKIIQYGLSHGYTFKALDENSYGAHHGVNN